jgi:hypothetical protein
MCNRLSSRRGVVPGCMCCRLVGIIVMGWKCMGIWNLGIVTVIGS